MIKKCKKCKVPLEGFLYRLIAKTLFGVRPSTKDPELCNKCDLSDNINGAINSTLGRTINTSGTVMVVLLTMMFFGGEVLRGMIFALTVGIGVGTYSSIFNATPIAYDFIMMSKRRKEKKLALLGKK